jgi:hypothetical protein
MFKLHPRSVKTLVVSFVVIIIVAALAIPSIAAASSDNHQSPGGPPPEQDGSVIEGTTSGSITFLATGSTDTIAIEMPSDTVRAVYSVSDSVNTLVSLRVVKAPPTTTPTSTPADQGWTHAKGIVSDGPITVTSTDGLTAVELTLPADTVNVVYTVSDSTNILEGIRAAGSGSDSGKGHKGIEGAVSGGPITITTADGAAVDLEIPGDTVEVNYNLTDGVYTLTGLRICTSEPPSTPGGTPAAEDGTRIQGTVSGAITFLAAESEDEITLAMPADTVYVVYSTEDSTNTLEKFSLHEPGQDHGKDKGPCPSVTPTATTTATSTSTTSMSNTSSSQGPKGNGGNNGQGKKPGR